MTPLYSALISLLGSALFDKEPKSLPQGVSPMALIDLADFHRVSAIAATALEKQTGDCMDDKAKSAARSRVMGAKMADAIQHFALEELMGAFDGRGVDYAMFKGPEIKKLYPFPYLREMLDIDLIVRPEQWFDACALVEKLGYEPVSAIDMHNVYLRGDVKLELHRLLLSERSPHFWYENTLRQRLVQDQEKPYRYRMTMADEYLFALLHAEKHIISASFMLRFITDIALYRAQPDYEQWREQLKPQLKALELDGFASNLEKLADGWLRGMEMDEQTQAIGELIMRWDHTMPNDQSVYKREWCWQSRNRGLKALRRRLFPSRAILFACRPSLAKTPWLLPAVYAWYLLRHVLTQYPAHRRALRAAKATVPEAFIRALPAQLALLYGKNKDFKKTPCQTDKAMLK